MAYALAKKQPNPRAKADLEPERHAERAPGLYPGEVLLQIDGGTLVAASVVQKWLSNNAGVALHARARLTARDGSTRLCPHGQHVATSATHNAPSAEIEAHGVQALTLEVLLLALGEPPRLFRGEGDARRPVIDVSDDYRAHASIRAAKAAVSSTAATADLSTIIGALR